jgi:hypothetical protein
VLGADGFGAVKPPGGAWSGRIPRGTFTDLDASSVSGAEALKLSMAARSALSDWGQQLVENLNRNVLANVPTS